VRKFWEMSGATPLSGKMRLTLEEERGVSFADAIGLQVIAEAGQYADRTVTYFRVFDSAAVAATGSELRYYDDVATEFILYSGHIDEDSTIVLDVQPNPGGKAALPI
jgi:hypothetical protein